jgi:hypothetical protein
VLPGARFSTLPIFALLMVAIAVPHLRDWAIRFRYPHGGPLQPEQLG